MPKIAQVRGFVKGTREQDDLYSDQKSDRNRAMQRRSKSLRAAYWSHYAAGVMPLSHCVAKHPLDMCDCEA